jgi:hypothetical protein
MRRGIEVTPRDLRRQEGTELAVTRQTRLAGDEDHAPRRVSRASLGCLSHIRHSQRNATRGLSMGCIVYEIECHECHLMKRSPF